MADLKEKKIELIDGKILIVDDESSIRNVVRMYLEYYGLNVKEASDGLDALEMVKEENFDIVLSDIMMPRMDGLTLAGEIGKYQPNTLVILMTGYASVTSAIEAIQKDVFDYIIKPFQNMQIVTHSIKRALERKNLLLERKALIEDLRNANSELAYNRGLLEEKFHEVDTELGRRVKRLTMLYDISQCTTSITDLSNLLGKILRRIVASFGDALGASWLVDHENKRLNKVATAGFEQENSFPDSFMLTEGEVGETMNLGYVRVFRDISELSDPVFRSICDQERVNSVILLPLRYENDILGVISVLFRNTEKAISDDDVSLLKAIGDQVSVSIKNADLYASQQQMFRETIEALATAIDSRDNYTGGHSNMVTRYSLMIAEKMGLDEDAMELIRVSGILHDVGKIGISDAILNKPGRLSDEEMGVIKAHPVLGRFILESIGALKQTARIVYHHHERYDGRGYPDGISQDRIPLESRILQVADIFDAITSDRVYRKAMPLEKAIAIIKDGLGTVSDPEVGAVFLKLYEDGELTSLLE